MSQNPLTNEPSVSSSRWTNTLFNDQCSRKCPDYSPTSECFWAKQEIGRRATSGYEMLWSRASFSGIGGPLGGGSGKGRAAKEEWQRKYVSGRSHFLSGGSGSLGLTPYSLCRARPQGHAPKVTIISMVWRNLAKRFPFRARVHTGHRCSQKSGSNLPPTLSPGLICLRWGIVVLLDETSYPYFTSLRMVWQGESQSSE